MMLLVEQACRGIRVGVMELKDPILAGNTQIPEMKREIQV